MLLKKNIACSFDDSNVIFVFISDFEGPELFFKNAIFFNKYTTWIPVCNDFLQSCLNMYTVSLSSTAFETRFCHFRHKISTFLYVNNFRKTYPIKIVVDFSSISVVTIWLCCIINDYFLYLLKSDGKSCCNFFCE